MATFATKKGKHKEYKHIVDLEIRFLVINAIIMITMIFIIIVINDKVDSAAKTTKHNYLSLSKFKNKLNRLNLLYLKSTIAKFTVLLKRAGVIMFRCTLTGS